MANLCTTALLGLCLHIPYAVYLLLVYWLATRYLLTSNLLLTAWTRVHPVGA